MKKEEKKCYYVNKYLSYKSYKLSFKSEQKKINDFQSPGTYYHITSM